MFNTFFSGSYTLISLFCVVFGVAISAYGFSIGSRWKEEEFSEEQYILEKKLYLVITFFSLGVYLRLLLAPLWLFTLKSLVPFVPGAMCILGVHLAMGKVAFYATALKLFVPALYGYWLVINWLDRKLESQPFMKAKLLSLVPIGFVMSAESALDFISLLKISPKPVSCCSSVFDVPSPGVPRILTGTSWFWVVVFALALSYILFRLIGLIKDLSKANEVPERAHSEIQQGVWACAFCGGVKHSYAQGIFVFLDIVFIFTAFFSFLMALHTKLSPLFLNMPLHHCIFCLWFRVPDVPLASAAFFAGIWLYLIFIIISAHKAYDKSKEYLKPELNKIISLSFFLILFGVLTLTVHLLVV